MGLRGRMKIRRELWTRDTSILLKRWEPAPSSQAVVPIIWGGERYREMFHRDWKINQDSVIFVQQGKCVWGKEWSTVSPLWEVRYDEGGKGPSIAGHWWLGESVGTQWTRLGMNWEMRWNGEESDPAGRGGVSSSPWMLQWGFPERTRNLKLKRRRGAQGMRRKNHTEKHETVLVLSCKWSRSLGEGAAESGWRAPEPRESRQPVNLRRSVEGTGWAVTHMTPASLPRWV